MPILGVCWKFLFVGMNYHLFLIIYHYHRFLQPLVIAAFELTINYYHGIADAHKSCKMVIQLHVLFGIFWRLTYHGYHTPPFLALTQSFRFCPPWKGCFFLKIQGQEGWRTYEKYEFFLEWIIVQHGGDFLPITKIIGRGKSRKIGIIFYF